MPFLTSVARRKLKFLVNILTAITLLIAPNLAISADKVYRWRLAETWGPNFPIFGDTTKNMAKMVKEMSNGRLLIRID